MKCVVDLHSHSGHAGGVGNISLAQVATTMTRKGIDVFGTGDCLQNAWRADLRATLADAEPGLFRLADSKAPPARFLLQSEIILTVPVPAGGRKTVHTLLLFPAFGAADEAHALLERRGVRLGMGRPFVCCEDAEDVAGVLDALLRIDPGIEVIPAHVLTPQGIYGAANPVERMADVFGAFAERIAVVETGLSADPAILALIPELDSRTFLSNSDCHSAALNRVGRECTALDPDALSYDGIIEALRKRRVHYTAEFTPAEGRYFLTGHRAGVNGHDAQTYCYFSPDQTPEDGRCPLCGKPLTIGVLERALQLSAIQGERRTPDTVTPAQKAIHLVPLVEVLAAGCGVKSIASKTIRGLYDAILKVTGTETALWEHTPEEARIRLRDVVPEAVLHAIQAVMEGAFRFDPPGYDGTYGMLKLGERDSWRGIQVVHGRPLSRQGRLL